MAFDPNAPFEVVGGFDPSKPFEVVEPRTTGEAIKDTAIDVAKGVVGLGESVVGIADIATGNAAGKGLSAIGYDPQKTVDVLSSGYSKPRQFANEQISSANGFMETLGALVDNPSVAFGSIVESAPMSLSGVAAARVAALRMLSANGIKAGTTAATKFFADPKVQSALVRVGAAAEGAQTAGSIQESGRQAGKEWQDTVAPALAAGAGTAAIGVASSKIPGFRDAEATVASAGLGASRLGGNLLSSGKEIAKSMFKEGWLEELPQSMQEQIFTNLALDKPWDEGVGAAGAQGAVAGMGQGGGMTAASELANGLTRPEEAGGIAPPSAEAPMEAPIAEPAVAPPVVEKPKGPLATIAEKVVARDQAALEAEYQAYQPELPGEGIDPATGEILAPPVAEEDANYAKFLENRAKIDAENEALKKFYSPAPAKVFAPNELLRGLESVIPRESKRAKDGLDDAPEVDTGGFSPAWFRESTIEAFDREHGTAHAGKIKPLKIMSTIRSYLNGRQLNETQGPAWDYIRDYAAKKHGVDLPTQADIVASRAHEAATSPLNDTPVPTEAQKKAGNYKVGKVSVHGLDVSIENPAGSERSGTDKSGKAWSQPMLDHYGYIKGTVGKDKDHLDVFINPENPESDTVYVVDQVDPGTGAFDEHKLLTGFDSKEAAKAAYLRNYEPGWKGLGAITGMPVEQFKEWVESGKTKRPVALPIKREDLAVDPPHVAQGMDNPDNALGHFESAIPQEDRAEMADVFTYIRKNGLHRQTSFAQQLFNMVGGMYEKRTGKKLAILGGNADNVAKEATNELNTERRAADSTGVPGRDGAEGAGPGTYQGVPGDDRQAGAGPARTEVTNNTPDASTVPTESAPSGVSSPPAVSTQAAEPVGATAPASSQYNPFRDKAIDARAAYERLSGSTSKERAMAEHFPLGVGFGRGSERSRDKAIDSSVDRAVAVVEAKKKMDLLASQADAFDRGEITQQGRRVKSAAESEAERKAKKNVSLLPVLNIPGGHEITRAQWAKTHADYKTISVSDDGKSRYRSMIVNGALAPVFRPDARVPPATKTTPPPPDLSTENDKTADKQADISSDKTPITIEPLGDKSIIALGDIPTLRAKLKDAGFAPTGIPNTKRGGLVFHKKHEAAVGAALEASVSKPAGNETQADLSSKGETQKEAIFSEDIPNELWLKEKQDNSAEDGQNQYGVPRSMGPITGSFSRDLNLPVSLLVSIPGERGEQGNVRQDSLAYIRDNWANVSGEAVYVEIDPTGKAWLSEGNHRVMVAEEKGVNSLPTTVRYFSGGQRTAGKFAPDALLAADKEQTQKETPNAQTDTADTVAPVAQSPEVAPADAGGNKGDEGGVSAKVAGGVKEPWQMTRDEYLAAPTTGDKYDSEAFRSGRHSESVRIAIQKGESVPAEVLADYQDLQPKEPANAKPSVQAPSQPASEMTAAELLRAAADKMDGEKAQVKEAAPSLTKQGGEVKAGDQAKREDATAKTDLAFHDETMRRIQAGDATIAEYKAGFQRALNSKDDLAAELDKMTKADILSRMGGMRAYRYKNDKKSSVVRSAMYEIAEDFVLGGGYSSGMGESVWDAVGRVVGKTTEKDLQDHAKAVQESIENRKAKIEQMVEAVKDPKTYEDFVTYIRAKKADGKTFTEARMSLSPEQRATFDELTAEKSRKERGSRKEEARTRVHAAGATTGAEIIATKHTRDGYDLFVVQAEERVDREVYNEWNAAAKKMGGWYSKFRGNGAIPGFQFKSKDSAEAFQKYVSKGDTEGVKEQAQARRDAYADDRSQTAVERLTEMADKLEESADESLGRDRKANTSRRAGMAARAEANANSDKAMALTMRNIARAIQDGSAKFLDRVRQKAQVAELASIVGVANYAKLRAQYQDYGTFEKHRHDRPTIETADHIEFPSYTAFRSNLAKLGRQLLEQDGTKLIGKRLMTVADDVTDAYLTFAKENLRKVSSFTTKDGALAVLPTKARAEEAIQRGGFRGQATTVSFKRGEHLIILSPSEAQSRGIWEGDDDKRITLSQDFGAEIVEKSGKNIDVPWHFETTRDRLKRLAGMGIETPAELRAAAREYIGLREAPKAADKVKELERAMIGRRNDGMDFFPTPEATADEMVQAAGIEPGMKVLEPSAGWGHIAERIRAAGVEPDVVEMSSDRQELLEAKGFNVVGRDFLDTEGQYDRIIMNPPFSDRRDAEHVQHAYSLLNPGGRLVAIMGEGVFFGKDKKAQAFREWLESVGGTDEKLEQGTFLDPSLPVNTGVNSRMVVIEKETDKGVALYSKADSNTLDTAKKSAYSGDAFTDGETLGLKVHYGQADLAGEMAKGIGGERPVIPWRMPDSLVRHDRKGRVVTGGRPKSHFELAERLATLFDKKIVWATIGDTPEINGVVVRTGNLAHSVFIDVRTNKPAHVVLGHELSHFLESEHPQVFQDLFDSLAPLIKDVPLYRETRNVSGLSDLRVKAEIVGDLLGDNFNRPEFWQEVAGSSPKKFRAIAARVRQWLSDLLTRITGLGDLGSDQFVSDIVAARKHLARAVVESLRVKKVSAQIAEDVGAVYSKEQIIEAAKTIYSKLEQVAKINFLGMKAQGVANFLSKQGVKKAEMEAVGLAEWLAAKKPTDKVTQAELVDFIKANTVELEDVVLGKDQVSLEAEAAAWMDRYAVTEMGKPFAELDENDQDYIRGKAEDYGFDENLSDGTHFSQYTEPGAVDGSYREMFITAPGSSRLISFGEWVKQQGIADVSKLDPNESDRWGEKFDAQAEAKIWQDGHSQYSEIKNPVVRIRFNEVQADGKKILRIEEMQGPNPENQKKMPAHLKDNIYQLGVKRILAYAKENGFDGVALATKPGMSAGETQADRYSLEKQIDSITYTDDGVLRAFKGRVAVITQNATKEELPNVIGKDAAKKLLEKKSEDGLRHISGIDLRVGGEGLKQLYDTQLPAMLEAYGKGKMVDVVPSGGKLAAMRMGKTWSAVAHLGEHVKDGFESKQEADKWIAENPTASAMPYLPITPSTPASYPMYSKAMSLENLEEVARTMGSITVKKRAKVDSTFLDRIFSTPEYYFKKFAAAGRVLKAALDRRDVRFTAEQKILGKDFVSHVQALRKNNKEAYAEANDYLVGLDQSGEGFSLKEEDETWKVIGPDGKMVSRHDTEALAVAAMVEAESAQLEKNGYSQDAIQAVRLARELTNRGFDVMAADMRKIIAEAKEAGLPNPLIGDGTIDESGRYGIYGAHSKKPIALFATEQQANEAMDRAAEMVSYVVQIQGGGERGFMSEIKANAWARKHKGTVKGRKTFGGLTVRMRTDVEMRPMTVQQALAQMGDMRGTYFPRIRKPGEYVLIAKKDGENPIRKSFDLPMVGDDKPTLQKLINSMTPMGREASKLKAQGYDVTLGYDESPVDDVFSGTNIATAIDAILQDSMAVIDKNNQSDIKAGQQINQLITMQVADIFKARGYLSSRLKRMSGDTVWEGYETDMGKALTQYGKGIAAGTAKRDTARAMVLAFSGRDYSWDDYKQEVVKPVWSDYQEIVEERRIDPRRQKNLFVDVRAFMIDVLRNDEKTDRIIGTMKGLAVLKFLAFRVSSAAVNATNMVTGVPATLSGHAGISLAKAGAHISSGAVSYGKYRSGKGELSEADRAIFQEISDRGWDDAQFNQEAARELRGELGEAWNKIMTTGMFMFGAVEKANRAVTIFAAYKAVAEKTPGMSPAQVWEKAKQVSDNAHGVYGKETRPAWTRGSDFNRLLSMPYTFTKFSHNYLLNMIDLGYTRGEYKAAAYLLLSPAILSGAGATIATPVLVALASALGIGGDDPEEELYAWAGKTFGTDSFARHGLAGGLLGINLKGSLQINNPMPTKLSELGGAPGAIVTDTWKAIQHLGRGEVSKGIETLLPTAIGSMSKAARESTEGITTGNYGQVFYGNEPLKADGFDAALRFFSFNPSRLSGIREKQWNEKEVAMKYQERKKEIYAKIKRLHIQGKGITPEVGKEIARYNDLVRGSGRSDIKPITPKNIRLMLKLNNRASKFERSRAVNE